jgi:hypothetical protein
VDSDLKPAEFLSKSIEKWLVRCEYMSQMEIEVWGQYERNWGIATVL